MNRDYDYNLYDTNSSMNFTNMNETYTIKYQSPFIQRPIVVLLLFLYTAVVVVGIGGNVFVCCTIYHMKKQTVTNFFMANLASSDILMATVCIPFTVLSNLVFHHWPFGAAMCPVVGFVQVTSVLQRAFTLVSITFDQHRIVWRPLQKRLDKRTARIIIGVLWILAILASTPVPIFAKIVEIPNDNGKHGVCMEDWQNKEHRYMYSITVMVLQYFLPLAIMTVCYTHIGIIVWLKKTPGESDSNRVKKENKSKRKTVRMLVTVVIAYALSWLPLHTLTLVGDSYPEIYDLPHIDVVWMFSHLLAFSSTGINPIIYCRSNSAFRKSLLRILQCYKTNRMVRGSFNKQLIRRRSTQVTKC